LEGPQKYSEKISGQFEKENAESKKRFLILYNTVRELSILFSLNPVIYLIYCKNERMKK
jgi:hypothetical protein